MGASLDNIVGYLILDQDYAKQFQTTFPKEAIQSATVSRAISQYVRSLISQTSPQGNRF